MQVSSWVKEAIDEAALYAALDHQPDVADAFLAPASAPLRAFAAALDESFFNVINQSCGECMLASPPRSRARAPTMRERERRHPQRQNQQRRLRRRWSPQWWSRSQPASPCEWHGSH